MLTCFLSPSANMIAVGSDGNLGVGVLRRFVVTFDYAGSRMFLQPNAAFAEPFPFPTSGLHLEPGIADDGSIGIHSVYADSPATRAGLAVGDRIVSVNARPVRELGVSAIRERFKQAPGTRVTLEVRRGDTVRELELKLARVL